MRNLTHPTQQSRTKMRILVDADLLLEFFMNRRGYVENTEKLLSNLQSEEFEAYITSWCIKKNQACAWDIDSEENIATTLKDLFHVIDVNQHHVKYAQSLAINDPESAVEVACAFDFDIGAIITNDPKNFVETTLLKLSVDDLLGRQPLEKKLREASLPLGQLLGKLESYMARMEAEIDGFSLAIDELRRDLLESGSIGEDMVKSLLYQLVEELDKCLINFQGQVADYKFDLSRQIFVEKNSWFLEEVTLEQNHIREQTTKMVNHINLVHTIHQALLSL
jgi:rRNA-processing protein FCF1